MNATTYSFLPWAAAAAVCLGATADRGHQPTPPAAAATDTSLRTGRRRSVAPPPRS